MAEELALRYAILRQLKEHLSRAQARMVKSANKHHRDVQFEVVQQVFLKFRAYRQSSLARNCVKLAPKFYGPFEVVAQVGKVAFACTSPIGLVCILCSTFPS